MKPSLSMILPVRNAQATVSSFVAQALEVLPEMTPRWDLLIIDDGSIDATPEIVAELTRFYPQVAVIHHSTQRGEAACFRSGVRQTAGDVLLFRGEECDLNLSGIHKMWKRIAAHDLVIARSYPAAGRGGGAIASGGVVGAGAGALAAVRPTALSPRRPAERSGQTLALQMIRRRALAGWAAGADEDLQQYLARKAYPQHEVDLSRALPTAVTTSRASTAGTASSAALSRPQHCDSGAAGSGPRRPNYLTRLKAFALGE